MTPILKSICFSALLVLGFSLPAQTIKKVTNVIFAKRTSDSTSSNNRNNNVTYTFSETEFTLDMEFTRDVFKNFNVINIYKIKKKTDEYIVGLIENQLKYEYIFFNKKNQECFTISYNYNKLEIRSIGKNENKLYAYNKQLYKKLNLGYTPKEVVAVLIQDLEFDY